MTPNQILDITVRAGFATITSGAEIYRVATTVDMILKSFDIEADSYVIASGIFITVKTETGESFSTIKAVKSRPTDLRKLEKINDFSRKFCKHEYTYEEASNLLKDIEKPHYYKMKTNIFAAFSFSTLFALFAGGSILGGIISGLVSAIIFYLQSKLFSRYLVLFFDYYISAALGSLICLGFSNLTNLVDLQVLIVGFIMSLVPGGPITTAMKDAFYGDVLSSIYKFFDSLFISFAIGTGIISVLLLKDVIG